MYRYLQKWKKQIPEKKLKTSSWVDFSGRSSNANDCQCIQKSDYNDC